MTVRRNRPTGAEDGRAENSGRSRKNAISMLYRRYGTFNFSGCCLYHLRKQHNMDYVADIRRDNRVLWLRTCIVSAKTLWTIIEYSVHTACRYLWKHHFATLCLPKEKENAERFDDGKQPLV